MQPLGLKKKII